MLFGDLLDYFYKNNNDLLFGIYRILCVDGTHSPLSQNLKNDDYKLTPNNTYVDSLISGLYDISNKTIVDFHLSNSKNENKQYKNQFIYLKENDIIIHDRGYFNPNLLYNLHIKKVNSIFRMKKNYIIVKDILKSNKNDKIYTICNKNTNWLKIKLRLVKYKIKGEIYILGTTLTDNIFSIDVLKKLYKKRWRIEEYFKTIKYCLSFKDFHSKTEEQVKQEMYIHMFCTLLTRTLEEIYKKHNNKLKNKLITNKTNFKNNIDKVCNRIIKILFYQKDKYVKDIIKILQILFIYLIKIRKNRSFLRKRIKPVSNFYQHPQKIK